MTPKEAAISLIKTYVLRGDTVDHLARSYLGSAGSDFWASIESGKKIVVKEIGEVELDPPVTFSLPKIYDEILNQKREPEQLDLFAEGA